MERLLLAFAVVCAVAIVLLLGMILRARRRRSLRDHAGNPPPWRNPGPANSVPPRPVPTAAPDGKVAAPCVRPVYSQEDDARYQARWDSLSGAGKDTLVCLCRHGPTWDGDVPSKAGRDELLEKALAAKIVLKDNEQGYQAATYLGSHVYRVAFLEPRKDIVRAAVGPDNAEFVRPR